MSVISEPSGASVKSKPSPAVNKNPRNFVGEVITIDCPCTEARTAVSRPDGSER